MDGEVVAVLPFEVSPVVLLQFRELKLVLVVCTLGVELQLLHQLSSAIKSNSGL